jgi:hypothetical protein
MKTHHLTKLALIIFITGFLCHPATAQIPKKGNPPQWIYGLTIERLEKFTDSDLATFKNAFNGVTVPITLRILFQAETLPSQYDKLIDLYNSKDASGKRRFYIMALLFDSQALKDYKLHKDSEKRFNCAGFTTDNMNYNQRTKCFVERFKNNVDVWEVGNEVNGEWADEKYNDKTKKDESFKGNYKETIKKIDTVIKLVPNEKPLALTVSYMPDCGEWKDNAMETWIKHFKKETTDKIDYVLISYYEDKCEYKVLNADDPNEINDKVIKPLRTVFKNQFIGFGETGYAVDETDPDSSENCPDNQNCYCRKGGNPPRKSKISQMQRYYGFKATDDKYIGGGFWWNGGEDYLVADFLAALKNQFACLATNQRCEPPQPVDCR